MCSPIHARFLTLLPRIETHAKVYFRYIRCADKRADQIAETIALAWKWFLKLEERGKDACQFVSAIATFAAKAVGSGRRLAGFERAKDVMNDRTQRRRGFRIERLPDYSTMRGSPENPSKRSRSVASVPCRFRQGAFRRRQGVPPGGQWPACGRKADKHGPGTESNKSN